MGHLIAIWIKRMKLGPMDPRGSAVLDQKGIVGNSNRGGKRQITLIQEEVWKELCVQVGKELDPRGRRANLMVRGIELKDSRGKFLRIGSVVLKINGETKPCERMDEFCQGLKDLMCPSWKGGAYAEVIKEGIIEAGQEVEWMDVIPD